MQLKTIFVPPFALDEANRLLAKEQLADDDPQDKTIFSDTTSFSDGHVADIDVMTGQTNAWVGVTLRKRSGEEVAETITHDSLEGDHHMEDGPNKYILTIKRKEIA